MFRVDLMLWVKIPLAGYAPHRRWGRCPAFGIAEDFSVGQSYLVSCLTSDQSPLALGLSNLLGSS